jgi:hypothetical protein
MRRRREPELGLKDSERIEQIQRSFEERGWQLSLKQEGRDAWVAWFFQKEAGLVLDHLVRKSTAVGAASSAWEMFRGIQRDGRD